MSRDRPSRRAEGDALFAFDAVFASELRLIAARRAAGGAKPASLPPEPANAFPLGLVGLSLSGGGIRSASVNLGLLQALGKRGALHHVDYLSTVSGGGYIGACLSSLCSAPWTTVRPGETFPFWFNGVEEGAVVKYLRQNRQYLGVEGGLLHLRTWRAISAYLGGLLVTLSTVALMLAIAAGLFLSSYGWGTYLVGRLMGASHAVARGDAQLLFAKPYLYLTNLFLPSLVALALWFGSGLAYAVANFQPRLWTLEFRAGLARVQAALLAGAVVLAIGGAMPFALLEVNRAMEMLRPYLTSSALLSLLSLPGVLKLSQNVKGAETLLRSVQRLLVAFGASILVGLICFGVLYWTWLWQAWALWIAVAALLGLVLLSLLTDINRVSMFYFYRDRLSDAFVIRRDAPGAEVLRNDPVGMADLAYDDRRVPYHLVNTCVNLPGSHEPAIKDRRGDFFLISPLFCGSRATGYRRTRPYENNRVSLASALAVSGAAANPQFGTATRPALAFLLTMLNARLGVWAENPRAEPRRYLPELAPHGAWPLYLLADLLSTADEHHDLINLSDGGHIENLGVYELLRRRCRVLIVSDASADPGLAFDDLANLVRKARIDLGIEIRLDIEPLRKQEAHVAVGKVLYPLANDEHPDEGVLLYVKATLTPADPVDLHQYKAGHPTFPHESTTDQFFDEAQFESYRALGYEAGRALWKAAEREQVVALGVAPAAVAPKVP